MVPLRHRRSYLNAFTFVEMLCVLAIIGVITVLTVTSMQYAAWSNVKEGASTLGNTVDFARQHAIFNRCVSALVVATEGADAYRAFAVIKKADTTNWSLISRWQKLPEGTVFDYITQSNFFSITPATNMPPTLNQSGNSLAAGTGYKALEFYSNGQIQGNNPSTLRVIQGHMDSTQGGPAQGLSRQNTNRYMDVVMIPVSGKVKYSSP